MAALSLSIDTLRPLNRWDHSSIRPGVVGSVGDVNLTPRFRHSAPDMPLRFDPYFAGKRSVFLGSNVQNGTIASYDSGGGPSRTIDSNWGGRRRFKVRHGWICQDMRAPDKLTEPLMGATPDYSWHNKLATVYESRHTGDKFLPLPHGYIPSPGELTRGGAFPYTRDFEPGTAVPGSALTQESVNSFRERNGYTGAQEDLFRQPQYTFTNGKKQPGRMVNVKSSKSGVNK